MTCHELTGLEADNLLAFLALLGLLRALEAAREDWRPRASWGGTPCRARLDVEGEAAKETIVEATVEGLAKLAPAYDFGGRKNINHSAAEFREDCEFAAKQSEPNNRLAADLLCALGSEAVQRRGEDRIAATALCAIHGQGHQNFLERLVAAMVIP